MKKAITQNGYEIIESIDCRFAANDRDTTNSYL